MILTPKETAVAYRCPSCGGTVISMFGAFSLSGDMFRLKCSCGKSELVITDPHDGKLRLTVPCIFCAHPHIYTVSRKLIMEKESFSFSCAYSGIDICFTGTRQGIYRAMQESDKAIIELSGGAGLPDTPEAEEEGDAHMRDLIILVLGQLADDHDIICDCGSDGSFRCDNRTDSVTITCKKCGKSRTISCSSTLETEALFDCEKFYLE